MKLTAFLLDEATVPMLLSGPPSGKTQDDLPFQLAQRITEKLQFATHFEFNAKTNRIQLTAIGLAEASTALTPFGGMCLERPWNDYVEKALLANYAYLRDVHYIVASEKVVIVDESTGRLHADRSWRDGLHQAIEMKDRVPLTVRESNLGSDFAAALFTAIWQALWNDRNGTRK